MSPPQSTEFVRLLRFQILDARNGAISGEPDAIRLCGYAADEIERLQLLAADYGGQLTTANAEIGRLRSEIHLLQNDRDNLADNVHRLQTDIAAMSPAYRESLEWQPVDVSGGA
jgi:septal ring factor EnvC (AmiA/AmiB activator)